MKMDIKAINHTIKRIVFVAVLGYLIPISLGLYFDSLLTLPRIPFSFDFSLETVLFFFGLFLIFLGCYDLIKYGNGSPNPMFPTKILVKGGLYKYIRHPIYLGWLIITLAASIYLGSLSVLGFLFVLIIFVHFYVKKEEKIMEKRFGKYYQTYRRKVPGWIPRIW
jgi:protein-S-isoprenylcysteine O-methyltransferase Ste14